MRLLAIGDIHGCYDALQALQDFVPFEPDDVLVTLGDYVDRGPDSRQVVDWVMRQTDLKRCVPLRGNHEVMMLAALMGSIPLEHWLQFGGREALASYSPDGEMGTSDDIPVEHLLFLKRQLHPFFETDSHIFVHASANPQRPMELQSDTDLYWERFERIAPHRSGKVIICGHTAQRNGLPVSRGHAICIDTWVYGAGWLTCLDVASGQYWQANQLRQTRTGQLSPES